MERLNINLIIKYDSIKPNGMKRKKLDLAISKKYGWKAKTSLDEAFKQESEREEKKKDACCSGKLESPASQCRRELASESVAVSLLFTKKKPAPGPALLTN